MEQSTKDSLNLAMGHLKRQLSRDMSDPTNRRAFRAACYEAIEEVLNALQCEDDAVH